MQNLALMMELDTVASISILSEATWYHAGHSREWLYSHHLCGSTPTQAKVQVIGQRIVTVEYRGIQHLLLVVVGEGNGSSHF